MESREVQLPLSLKPFGRIRARSVREIRSSNFRLGCETLDRDFADFHEYAKYIPGLGIKMLRFQGGWAKTEQKPGVYDFAWMDELVDSSLAMGVNPLIETDYGNPIYPGGGGWDLAGSFPNSPEALAAWDAWVRALAVHFKGRVQNWAMWNEPDICSTSTVEDIVAFNNRTAAILREVIPGCRIAGLSLASSDPVKFEKYIALLQQCGTLEQFDWIIYHGYKYNPDKASDAGNALQDVLRKYTSKVRLWQGENGCPSEETTKFALQNCPWTELSQAKWDLRRYLADLGNDVETSVFTICDFNHRGRQINRKGLLLADENHKVLRPKLAYYAIQHLTSIFDDELTNTHLKIDINTETEYSAYTFSSAKGNLVAYWDRSDTPTHTETILHDVTLKAPMAFRNPVFVEMLSGNVYAIPAENIVRENDGTIFRNLPFADTPFVIADADILAMEESCYR